VTAIRGMPEAPVGVMEREVSSDVVAATVSRATEAARRVAGEWSSRPRSAVRLARDPSLWSASPDLAARLEPRLREWVASIATEVQARGAPKRDLAFGVSLGVNALAVAAMVGVFAHTAGVTGTELGIVAATGFLNQKLLQAIFGEAAMREMIANARERLEALIGDEFSKERDRYDRLTSDPAELRTLAEELRAATPPLAWVAQSARDETAPLLRWLDVKDVRDHANGAFADVAILDLPDIDSTTPEHRARVDELLPRVDAVVWVADPEKYRDAVLHDQYLRRWAPRLARQLVVLNKADRVGPEAEELRAHLVASLRAEGIENVNVAVTTATRDGDAHELRDW